MSFTRTPKTDEQIGTIVIDDLPEKLVAGLRSGDIMGALTYYLNFYAETEAATDCLIYADISEIEALISQGSIDDIWLTRYMDLQEEVHVEMQAELENAAQSYMLSEGFASTFAKV